MAQPPHDSSQSQDLAAALLALLRRALCGGWGPDLKRVRLELGYPWLLVLKLKKTMDFTSIERHVPGIYSERPNIDKVTKWDPRKYCPSEVSAAGPGK